MKPKPDGYWGAIINLIETMEIGSSFPIPLNHLMYHPELMNDGMVEKIKSIREDASLCIDNSSQELIGLGELMLLAGEHLHLERDLAYEEMTSKIQRVGSLVNSIGGLIYWGQKTMGNADYALSRYAFYKEGNYRPHTCVVCDQPCGTPKPEAA